MKKKSAFLMATVLFATVTVVAGGMQAGRCGNAVLAAEDETWQGEAVIATVEDEESEEADAPALVEEDRFLDVEEITEYTDAPSWASDVVDSRPDGTLTWQITADGTLTISGTGEMNDYESASTYPWYLYKEDIRSIVIEAGVTSIGSYAFAEYTNLSAVTLPSTLTLIGQHAFDGCASLTSVTLPDGLVTIGAGAFANTGLTIVVVPASVTEIGDEAFYGCSALVSVTLSDGLLRIGAEAFMNCVNLEKITFPDTLTTIGSMAFVNTGITSVRIPQSVTSIGSYALGFSYSATGVKLISGFVIYCYNATAGTAYSVEYGVTFVQMNLSLYDVTLDKYSYTYTGEEFTPAVTVKEKDGTTVLTEGVEYTVEYTDNINAGTATVTVTGAGGYIDTLTATFSIVRADISKCTVTLVNTSSVYSSIVLEPKLDVTFGTYSLTNETDYTVTYSNNINAGTATYTLTGIGNFTGVQTGTFSIAKSSQSVTASAAETSLTAGETTAITATGKGTITYTSSDTSIATVDSNGAVTAKKPGTVKITVTAAGNSNYEAGSTTVTITVRLAKGTITSLTNKSSGITVKWEKITGASGYYLYRRTSSGSYSLIATIEKASTVSYTDTEVAENNGTGYYYKVVAYSGATTGTGTGKKIVRLTGTALTGVTNSASGKIVVKWSQSTKVTGYQIQYSTDKSFATDSKTKKVSGKTSVSKSLSGLTKGETYYVRIRTYRTVNGTTYYSAWSSKLKVKITK